MNVKVTNPLDDELYAAYAAGVLSAPMHLLVETQSRMNIEVLSRLKDSETLAGLLLEQSDPVSMSDSSLEQIFAIIDSEEEQIGEAGFSPNNLEGELASRRAAHKAGNALQELLNLPEPIRDLALENPSWSFASPGVKVMPLIKDGDAKAELIRLEPGRGVPHHGHNCREFTLVLTGAYHDGRARYGRGDLSIADPDTIHKPIAEMGEVCIALAVTDGSLAFTGALGWIQRAFQS